MGRPTPAQDACLAVLRERGEARLSEIAREAGLRQVDGHQALKRLAKRGLVEHPSYGKYRLAGLEPDARLLTELRLTSTALKRLGPVVPGGRSRAAAVEIALAHVHLDAAIADLER